MWPFKPAWKSENESVALNATRKIKKPETLFEIANTASSLAVRKEAAYKYVSIKTNRYPISILSVGKYFADPLLLAEFVISWQNHSEYSSVINAMTDQDALFYIARSMDGYLSERYNEFADPKAKMAADRLTDRELLNRLNSKYAAARLRELDIDLISAAYMKVTGSSSDGTISGTIVKGRLKIGDTICISHAKGNENLFVLTEMYKGSMPREKAQEANSGESIAIPENTMGLSKKVNILDQFILYSKK
jgi:hypothetical protein